MISIKITCYIQQSCSEMESLGKKLHKIYNLCNDHGIVH